MSQAGQVLSEQGLGWTLCPAVSVIATAFPYQDGDNPGTEREDSVELSRIYSLLLLAL